MEEVVVDVREHAGARPEVVEGALEPLGVRPVLLGSDGGVRRCNLEDDGCLLVCEGRLGGELVRECIAPVECDPDLGEAELEQLELSEVLV